ncbi:hypothetical protein PAPYR_12945 [Paratrimastix pyriformis]|uniref:Uncharacterized protein n=1 Tax=Paratrimastix pyriformis TaxID=342808 RepID=A0ABQ8U120_9EUKA|nr:hypothetical protein PAPYR_12945 [Paratrimastix pyriformis]
MKGKQMKMLTTRDLRSGMVAKFSPGFIWANRWAIFCRCVILRVNRLLYDSDIGQLKSNQTTKREFVQLF